MSIRFKFIHASDMHLGSVLHVRYKNSNKMEKLLKEAVYIGFKRICNAAIEYDVSFIVISGDIYDREFTTVKGSKVFYDECNRLKEYDIDVYLIRGNHDPLEKTRELFTLPDNVHVFAWEKAETIDVYKNNSIIARIIGQSYKNRWERKNMVPSYEIEDSNAYTIGVLHTALEPNKSNYVPCTVEDLKGKESINYWALGHIHKCKIINNEKPVIAYSGIHQGRDIGEEGVGGCFLVEVMEDLSEHIEFIPTSPVVWRRIKVNINDCEKVPEDINELEELLIKKGDEILNSSLKAPENLCCTYPIDKVVEGYIVQWIIEGRGKIHELLCDDKDKAEKHITESMNKYFLNSSPFLYSDSVIINTSKEMPDLDYLIKSSEIIREVENLRKRCFEEDDLKRELINSFGKIFENDTSSEDIDEEKIQLNEELIEEIVKDAEELIIEKFLEKGEEA